MGIKHVVAGVAVVAGGLLLSGCDWGDIGATTFTDHESLGQSVSEVRFANDSGDVKITVGDHLEVRRTVGYHDTKPGKTYRVDGDALVLEECRERDCWVDYDVTVPEGTKVSGHVDSAKVEVVGVASVNVEAESGDVTVRDVDGEVNATAQSGNVDLSGIGSSVVAGAESGNVTVHLDSAANVTASASSGNVEVIVPQGNYQVRTNVDSGDVRNEVGSSASGPTLDLRTESGNITVEPA
jgi:major membrane immunogen (membrane-anchored lipoprotein)